MDEFSGRLNEERYNRQREQIKVALGLAQISPTAQLSLGLLSLAGTSLHLQDRFLDQARQYQETFAQFMKEKTGVNPGGGMMMWRVVEDDEEKPEKIDPNELPAFAFQPVPVAEAGLAAAPNFGLLLLGNLVCFVGSIIAFARYDVR